MHLLGWIRGTVPSTYGILQMSVTQVTREAEAVGLSLKEKIDSLPWQHILIFAPETEKTYSTGRH